MIKAIAGTKDLLPEDSFKWQYIEKIARETFGYYNFKEIRTPVFEETSLFKRGIGNDTDIVSKEMYTFTDRSETSVTLKPEMTAPVMRSFIEHSIASKQPLTKVFYVSPMFRQERPQAGRLRQFHQFGAEAIGVKSASLDAELIVIAYSIIKKLGISNTLLKINSLGMPETRKVYKNKLREYLGDFFHLLSTESQTRSETNILRLFDSKNVNDIAIMKDAPKLLDFLDDESKKHFDQVESILTSLNIPFEVDPKLVRGLDYYTDTTFEIISGSVGSQSALCGGGRYDLLAEQIGGKELPGVGFAAGIERILLAIENEKIEITDTSKIDLFIVRLDKELDSEVIRAAQFFRANSLKVEIDYSLRSIKAQMREANRNCAKYTLFIGGNEWKEGIVKLKNMTDSTEQNLTKENFISELLRILRD